MKISLPNEAEPGFQMAPMIDITFLLIIFFMLVAQQTQNQFKQITPSCRSLCRRETSECKWHRQMRSR